MGYYTRYELYIGDVSLEEEHQIIKDIEEKSSENFCESEEHCYVAEAKWYEHSKDLKAISLLHPNALFILEGSGEDPADIWKLYIKGGKEQSTLGKVVFEDYDPNKLK